MHGDYSSTHGSNSHIAASSRRDLSYSACRLGCFLTVLCKLGCILMCKVMCYLHIHLNKSLIFTKSLSEEQRKLKVH